MKKFSGPLARRYGLALYESMVAGYDNASVVAISAVLEEKVVIVRQLSSMLSKESLAIFANPVLANTEKKELLQVFLDKLFVSPVKPIPELVNFLLLLVDNNRILVLPEILNYFLAKVDELLGIARVTVVSVQDLSDATKEEFLKALTDTLQKRIVLETKTDKSLQAGFIVNVGYTKIDLSLRSRLLNLKEFLH